MKKGQMQLPLSSSKFVRAVLIELGDRDSQDAAALAAGRELLVPGKFLLPDGNGTRRTIEAPSTPSG